MHERAREREFLLHPAGQAIGTARSERRELRHREQAITGGVIAIHTVNLGEEGDVLVDGQVAVETESLREIPHRGGHDAMLSEGIVAEDRHAPAIDLEQSAGDADGGRLPSPIGADDAEHLAAGDRDRRGVERGHGAVFFRHLLESEGTRTHGLSLPCSTSSASIGMPGFNTPSRLSAVTLMR